MRTMLEVGHLPISVDSFVAQTRHKRRKAEVNRATTAYWAGQASSPSKTGWKITPTRVTLESTRYFHNAFGARLLKLVDE